MKTPEQLKGAVRNIASKQKLRPQEVLQMYLFERILERLANSDYRNNFILKGGLLISSMLESVSAPRWIWMRRFGGYQWRKVKSYR